MNDSSRDDVETEFPITPLAQRLADAHGIRWTLLAGEDASERVSLDDVALEVERSMAPPSEPSVGDETWLIGEDDLPMQQD